MTPAATATASGYLQPQPGSADSTPTGNVQVTTRNAGCCPAPPLRVTTARAWPAHLLGKLGAANRTETVTRARQLGLIP